MHGKLTFTEHARFLLSVNFLHSLVQIFLEFLSAHRRLATVSQFYTLRLSDWHLVQEFLQDSKIWWCQVVDSQREEGEGRERGAGNHTFTCLDLVILFLSEEGGAGVAILNFYPPPPLPLFSPFSALLFLTHSISSLRPLSFPLSLFCHHTCFYVFPLPPCSLPLCLCLSLLHIHTHINSLLFTLLHNI